MHEMQVTSCTLEVCMEDKWLVACKELRFTSPINSKFICTISSHLISSHQVVTQQQELELVESERKNIERKYSFSCEVSPSVSILLFQERG
ncbi:hypothetical protein MTR_4g030170 [Medicago truncatula]|uniref:Uncharacterized protein n=1 Tax=Medicago truncatula TaxID=3880 RepID=G7JKQ8_MEDTR|nr:hypothetical protein MTR_4g030170 [Medicago truncatula]